MGSGMEEEQRLSEHTWLETSTVTQVKGIDRLNYSTARGWDQGEKSSFRARLDIHHCGTQQVEKRMQCTGSLGYICTGLAHDSGDWRFCVAWAEMLKGNWTQAGWSQATTRSSKFIWVSYMGCQDPALASSSAAYPDALAGSIGSGVQWKLQLLSYWVSALLTVQPLTLTPGSHLAMSVPWGPSF